MTDTDTSPPRAATLRVKDLAKTYRTGGTPVPAVRGMDLWVYPGEFVAVMGPSGSGKSTLLHLLGGLDTPTAGEIWLRGQNVGTLSPRGWAMLRRKHIGFVFQTFNLISNMTVADNIELPALLAGARPSQARRRREELLEELGMSDKDTAPTSRLSGGEQQKVAIARALANDPSLILADEPTGSLDSRDTRTVLRLLQRVHDQGQTILLVTHDARVASLADRVITVLDGMIVDDVQIADRPGPPTSVHSLFDLGG